MSATSAWRERVMRLKSVDLPTLGRPTSTIVGFILPPSSLLLRSPHGYRVDAALAGLHQHFVLHAYWCGCNSAPVCAGARRERSVLDLEEVHLSFEVADDDMIAEDQRRTQAAVGEAVLLPRAGAGIFVERHHCT